MSGHARTESITGYPEESGNAGRFCHVNPAYDDDDDIRPIDQDDIGDGGMGTRTASTLSIRSEDAGGIGGGVVGALPQRQRRPAVVCVRDGKKSYFTGTPVLNGFNMTVEKGTIYGLLGSSGCGKTTMLSCIVGMRHMDSGTIHVFGKEPGTKGAGVPGKNVGYMPQDISLYGDFTITETLGYFGSLYCMSKQAVEKNRLWLVSFLSLPDPNRKVGTLSGGQQRRVSIAVAMIHDPKLLILDEPTVGVDPLLRESIWQHLVDRVSKDGATVIITTHYIEEAKQSNTVGLMRNGKLLAEKSPDELMTEHNASMLEDVVLKLCKRDISDEVPVQGRGRRKPVPYVPSTPRPTMATIDSDSLGGSFTDSMKRLYALCYKNAMVMIRNYLFFIFILWVPAGQVIFMCLALGNDPKPMNFGIVNHEFRANGRIIAKNCEDLLDLRKTKPCTLIGLSCEFLKQIPDDVVHRRFYETEAEARYEVQEGKIWGYMSFPEDFSNAYYTKVVNGSYADSAVLNSSTISLEMDETSKQITGTLKKQFGDSLKNFTKAMLTECGFTEKLAEGPVQIVQPVYGKDSTDSREFMSCGILVAILFFFPVIISGIQHIYEKRLGVLERTIVAGVNTWEVLAGFSITSCFTLLIQTILAFIIITVVFSIKVQGSYVLCVVLAMLVGLNGTSMGFLIATCCKEEVEATMISIALFFPVVMLSGIMWPLEGMPLGLQYFSYLLPCQMPAEALRSMTSRGWDFTHSHVWPGFASIIGWNIIYWIVIMFLHKMKWTR